MKKFHKKKFVALVFHKSQFCVKRHSQWTVDKHKYDKDYTLVPFYAAV